MESLLTKFAILLLLSSSCVWVHFAHRMWRGAEPLKRASRGRFAPAPAVALLCVLLWVVVPQIVAKVSGYDSAATTAMANTLVVLMAAETLLRRGELPQLRPWMRDQIPIELYTGGLGFLATVLPVLLVMLAMLRWRDDEDRHPLLQRLTDDASGHQIAWIVVAAVFVAPLAEELVFRVMLQGGLRQVMVPRRAILLTAIGFSLVHGLPDAIPLLPLALILGWVYEQRKSFVAVVVVHMLFNAVNIIGTIMKSQL